ncbi:hypothetical protein ACN28C_33680 [Plantactinospora sp. WMMC1484]|uniref:hypothetical protein n=1 Tax=Plantactinospora sp. WMMC1484 TaxID=3404122 RepID=UPI003BF5795E
MLRLCRRGAAGLAVLGLALALTACSDGGTQRDDVVEKIRSDPRMAGTSDRAVDCLADWYMEYATAEQREVFLRGAPGAAGAAGSDPDSQAAVDAAVLNCLRRADDTP